MKINIFFYLFASSFLFGANSFAGVTAYVDRNPISEGETVNFTLEVDASRNLSVDLSALKNNFEIVQKMNSQNNSNINGRQTAVSKLIITLLPKSTGELIIPSLQVGNEKSEAITLRVNAAPAGSVTKKDATELSVTLDKSLAYVQAQIVLTVRLSSAENIVDGSLSELKIADATVRPLGEQRRFRKVINGVNYDVIELSYAIFPQKSGSLTIPSMIFNGAVSDGTMRSFSGFFDSVGSRRIRKQSKELSVTIKPVPKDYPKDATWLPLKQLVLTEDWSILPLKFKVDEAITRTFRIEATGGGAAMLPSLPSSSASWFKQYPDKKTPDEIVNADGISTILSESQLLIPTKEGEQTLPEMKLVWFDTENEKVMTAIIAAKNSTVLPSDTLAKAPPPANSATKSAVPNLAAKQEANWPYPWMILCAIFLLLCLALIFWIMRLQRKIALLSSQQQENENSSLSHKQLLKNTRELLAQAIKRQDAGACAQALCSLAQAKLQLTQRPTLGKIPDYLNSAANKELIINLEALLYSHHPQNLDLSLLSAIDDDLAVAKLKSHRSKSSALPSLYPHCQV